MSWTDETLELIRCKAQGRVVSGLKRSELDNVQRILGYTWPPDLCELLRAGLPIGKGWPDWRALDRAGSLEAKDEPVQAIKRAIGWPLHGLLFDVENNSFWDPLWGERPESLEAAKEIATAILKGAPPLIPVYMHRYLPAEPCEAGNPVLSVYQMDIIVYGQDLALYFVNEFGGAPTPQGLGKPIMCWTRWIEQPWARP